MNSPITPRLLELVGKTDDELRETLSDLNNASLRKLAREAIKGIGEHRFYIDEQKEQINKMQKRLYNIIALAERKIE